MPGISPNIRIALWCYTLKISSKFVKHSFIQLSRYKIYIKVIEKNDYDYDSNIDKQSFDTSFPMLERTFEKERISTSKDDKFPLIYVITALYTTFILEEPIHPVGSEFPGSLKVEVKNGEFLCPVKDKQKDNTDAICHL